MPLAYEESRRYSARYNNKKEQRHIDIWAMLNGDPVYHGGEFGEDGTPKRDRMLSRDRQLPTKTVPLDVWQSPEERDEYAVAQHSSNDIVHPDIAPHTCSSCEKLCIDIRELVSDSWMRLKWWAFENGPDISVTTPTEITIYEAIVSASQGCVFWATLMKGNDHDEVYFSDHLGPNKFPDQRRVDNELGELYSDDDGNIMLSHIASRAAEPTIKFKLGRGPGQPIFMPLWVPAGKFAYGVTKSMKLLC